MKNTRLKHGEYKAFDEYIIRKKCWIICENLRELEKLWYLTLLILDPLGKKCPYSEFFWSECRKISTRKTPNTDTFLAVIQFILFLVVISYH